MKKYNQKKSVYFSDELISEEITTESKRQGRSESWLIQQAWIIARKTLLKNPAAKKGIEKLVEN